MKFGQYIPLDSILHNLDARTKIIISAVLLILIVLATFPYKLLFILIPTFYLVWVSKVKIKVYLEAIRTFAWLIFITVFLQLLLVKGPPFFEVYKFSVSTLAVQMALSLSIRICLLLIIIRVLTSTTSPSALMNGIEKLLKPFGRLGLPIEELVMIMTISLRFIPLFMEEAQRIHLAQKSRGINFQKGNIKDKLQGMFSLLIPLFRISFNRASDIATAMEVRCYDSSQKRSYLYSLEIEKMDYLYLFALLPIIIFTFV